MRNDNLARELDYWRWGGRGNISPFPAEELWRAGMSPVSGRKVASSYGLLAHYLTWDALVWVIEQGAIGGSQGCWLTPTPYAACMAPYDLGLNTPRNVCLLVDVSDLPELWGPGTSPPSGRYPAVWQGGGVEFFSTAPIDLGHIRDFQEIAPCGDSHL